MNNDLVEEIKVNIHFLGGGGICIPEELGVNIVESFSVYVQFKKLSQQVKGLFRAFFFII